MSTKKRSSKTLRSLTVGTLVAAAMLGGAPMAQADNGAGGNNGEDSGGTVNGMTWKVVSSKNGRTAWERFLYGDSANLNDGPQALRSVRGLSGIYAWRADLAVRTIPSRTSSKKNLKNVCQKSSNIWFVQGRYKGRDIWIRNYSGVTFPTGKQMNNWFHRASGWSSTAPTNSHVKAMHDWVSRTSAEHRTNNWLIVCDGVLPSTPTPRATPAPQYSSVSKTTEAAVKDGGKHPYSYTTDVKPQIRENGIDPIGKNNLHDQLGTVQKTNYGVLVDSIRAGKYKGSTPAAIQKLVDDAVAKDVTAKRSKIDLDAKNKEGMAEGGVLNVYERTTYATWSASSTTTTYMVQHCNMVSNPVGWKEGVPMDKQPGPFVKNPDKTWKYQEPKLDCSNAPVIENPKKKPVTTYANSATIGTPENTGFWQMLAVHCNKEQFDALMAAVSGATVGNSGDPSRRIAAVAYSKKYPAQPTSLDFGDKFSSNAAKKASGLVGFYDKECPFQCTSDKATTEGASAANGATSNMNASTPPDGTTGKYGALSGNQNNNRFEFFRDNTPHDVKVDVWYPKSNGVVDYKSNADAPLTTTVTRWVLGTPDVKGGDGGQFTMKTKSGVSLFDGEGSNLNQRNWDPAEDGSSKDYLFSTPTATMLDGLHRDFTVQSSWASEANRPQVINVKWEYAPMTASTFSTKGIGFDAGGAVAYGTGEKVAVPVQGKCYAEFGKKDSVATPYAEKVQAGTGTGTDNTMDGKLVDGESTPPADNSTELIVNFIRSTSE